MGPSKTESVHEQMVPGRVQQIRFEIALVFAMGCSVAAVLARRFCDCDLCVQLLCLVHARQGCMQPVFWDGSSEEIAERFFLVSPSGVRVSLLMNMCGRGRAQQFPFEVAAVLAISFSGAAAWFEGDYIVIYLGKC